MEPQLKLSKSTGELVSGQLKIEVWGSSVLDIYKIRVTFVFNHLCMDLGFIMGTI